MQRNECEQKKEILSAILKNCGMVFCEYLVKEDRLIFYDDTLTVKKEISDYLEYLQHDSFIHPEDRWKMKDFYQGKIRGETEVRLLHDQKTIRLLFQAIPVGGVDASVRLSVLVKDLSLIHISEPTRP